MLAEAVSRQPATVIARAGDMIRISASAGNPAGAGGQHCGEIDSGAFAEELSAGIEQSVTTIARLAT